MSKLAAMPLADYKEICDAVRAQTGSADPIRSGELAGMIAEITGGAPYEGAYEVTPTVEGFTLPTAKKVMQDDLTVKEIPFFDVGNPSGGSTVYIGSSVELS